MNAHVRDNLLETAAATATTAGDLVYADAANSMGSRAAIGGAGSVLVSTGTAPIWRGLNTLIGDASYSAFNGTSFADFNNQPGDPGVGTNVTVTVTTGTQALIWYGCAWAANSSAGAITVINYRISGATTDTGGNSRDIQTESGAANDRHNMSGAVRHGSLTAGSNVFTLQARVSAGVGTISYPYILVMAL
jgi:hypothetical protein